MQQSYFVGKNCSCTSCVFTLTTNFRERSTFSTWVMTQSARKKKILDFFFFSRKKMPNFSRLKACEFISRDQSHSQSLTLIHGQLSNKKIGSFFIRAQKCGRQPFLRKNHLLATITKEQTCFLSELLMKCKGSIMEQVNCRSKWFDRKC